LKAFEIAAIALVVFALDVPIGWHMVIAQVQAIDKTSPSAGPVAIVSEAKPTPNDIAGDSLTLEGFMKHEGFDVVKLRRQNLGNQKPHRDNPKHLIIDVGVNRVSASLMVDTGTPTTNIARASLEKFGVVEQKTSDRITSPLGSASNNFFGIATLATLAVGNCVITNVPILIDVIPFLDGVLGSEEMRKVGAVLDCAHAAVYVLPQGPSGEASHKLATMLQRNGFTQVPMRLTSDHRLEVSCSIDGIASTIIVDTGSAATCVNKNIGIKAGVMMKHTRKALTGSGETSAPMLIGRVKQFAIGDFEIRDADVGFIDLNKSDQPFVSLLGIGELISNSAIIDLGSLSMYLRHRR